MARHNQGSRDVGQVMPNYPHKWSDRLRSNLCQSSTVM
jgi:hypothetical protein